MKVEIRKYIAERYPRWHEFVSYHAEQQKIADHASDILHEVLLSVILMPEHKTMRLFNAQGGDYRELDYFVLKMLRLNCISPTAPYRHKYRPVNTDISITTTLERSLSGGAEYDDQQVDTAGRQFKQWELIRIIGECLELKPAERDLFTHVFMSGEKVASIEDENLTRKRRYEITVQLKEIIHSIIYKNGFTKIEPKTTLSPRAQTLVKQFNKNYKLGIINQDTPYEKFKIYDIMKKTVYWKDSWSIGEVASNLTKAQKALQSIVDTFRSVGIEITDPNVVSGMIDSQRNLRVDLLETFVFNALFPETPAGFKRDLYRGLVELPDLSAVKQSFESLVEYFGGIYVSDTIHFTAYTIQAGQVEIIPEAREKLEMRFAEVAESKEEHDRLNVVNNLCKTLDALVQLAEDHPANYIIAGVVQYDEEAGKFIPGRLFVKHGGKTQNLIMGNPVKPESLKSRPVFNEKIPAGATDDEFGAALAKRRNEAAKW